MSGPVSLLSLRTQVRKRADIENETVRHTNAELNGYINLAWNELYETVASTNEDYYSSQVTLTTTAGVDTIALPAAFLWIRHVTITTPDNIRYEMARLNLSEVDAFYNYGQIYAGTPGGYVLLGDNIQIVPTPQSAYSVIVKYVARPTDMAADVDTIDGKAGWEEFIIWKAVATVLAIDKRDTSMATSNWTFQKQRILEAAQRRNLHQPRSIIRRVGPRMLARNNRWGR